MKAIHPMEAGSQFSLFNSNYFSNPMSPKASESSFEMITKNMQSLRIEYLDPRNASPSAENPIEAQEITASALAESNISHFEHHVDLLLTWVESVFHQNPRIENLREFQQELLLSDSQKFQELESKYGSLMAFLTLKKKDIFNSKSYQRTSDATEPLLAVPITLAKSTPWTLNGLPVQAENVSKLIVSKVQSILLQCPLYSIKAVELANTLRALIGPDALSAAREYFGGMLLLLEQYPSMFKVQRIPKNDTVTLIVEHKLSDSSERSGSSVSSFGSNERNSGDSQPITRCLHIGNIPSHMSEETLRQNIERYEKVQSLKIIVKKGHRFAFVNFSTIEEAARVKVCLSKQRLWRSAVSYAKRESFEMNAHLRHRQGKKTTAPVHSNNTPHAQYRNVVCHPPVPTLVQPVMLHDGTHGYGYMRADLALPVNLPVSPALHSNAVPSMLPPSIPNYHQPSMISGLNSSTTRFLVTLHGPQVFWEGNFQTDWVFVKAITDTVVATQGCIPLPEMCYKLQQRFSLSEAIVPDSLSAFISAYPQFFDIVLGCVQLASAKSHCGAPSH
mmetsp:Transcript_16128/g.21331  ORF Transcript_16128/g.21331 Transcript_16128/m.21331 type:complete len:560 (+) Transcript_16128:166-1845(+)